MWLILSFSIWNIRIHTTAALLLPCYDEWTSGWRRCFCSSQSCICDQAKLDWQHHLVNFPLFNSTAAFFLILSMHLKHKHTHTNTPNTNYLVVMPVYGKQIENAVCFPSKTVGKMSDAVMHANVWTLVAELDVCSFPRCPQDRWRRL